MGMPSQRAALTGALAGIIFIGQAARTPAVEPGNESASAKTLLQENCFDCHGDGASEGDLQLDVLLDSIESEPDEAATAKWWAVLKNIRAGTMPPPDSGYQLDAADVSALKRWLMADALAIDFDNPNPGSVGIGRLNRREYENTIRDLLGVEFSATVIFPPDDTGAGFDTVGDALTISPMMMEKYIATASDLIEQSVPRVTKVIDTVYESDSLKTVDGRKTQAITMDREATVRVSFEIPTDETYLLDTTLVSDGTFSFSPDRCGVQILLDGESIHSGEYAWASDLETPVTQEFLLEKGEHTLEYRIRPLPVEDKVSEEADADAKAFMRIPSLSVRGPVDESLWSNPPGYKRFFSRTEPPQDAEARREYASEVLAKFLLRAYRRTAKKQQLQRLVALAEQTYAKPDVTFETGIATAMTAVLASPRFLMKYEATAELNDGEKYPFLDDYSLASRLSYFLWASMPDDELLELAGKGQLRQQLANQVDRMLEDPRCDNFLKAFVGQWLRTDDVQKVTIDTYATFGLREEYDQLQEEYQPIRRIDESDRTPEQQKRYTELRKEFAKFRPYRGLFDDTMRTAMQSETLKFVDYIFKEDRPLKELLDPGYTFLNERLAELYEIDGISGDEFRKVQLDSDHPRGGILTQGTLLTVTSNPTRTSPVKRGLYVLENILGTPTPPAPPNVPELEQSKDRFGGREPSLRELLAAHRESALCSSCHSRMDPLGLALENFNALGKFRTEDAGSEIVPGGRLVTGEEFSDVTELRRVLAEDRIEDFYRCLAEKLFVYGVGRDIQAYDELTIERVVDNLQASKATFRSIIHQLVASPAFQQSNQKPQ